MMRPTYPPSTFAAGDSVVFTQAPITTALGVVSPSNGWALTWLVRKTDGSDDVDVAASTEGDLFVCALTASASAALTPGAYRWTLRATKGADATTITQGTSTVTPDLSIAGEDVRTWEERTLAVVEQSIEGSLPDALKMYMIGGRQVMEYTLEERIKLRDRLRVAVERQQGDGFRAQVVVTSARRSDPWAF